MKIHFGFLIEPGHDGFPALTDAPSDWGNCMDGLVGERIAGRKDPEELRRQAEELDEWLKPQIDSEEDDYEEKLEKLLTAEQLEIRRRAEEIDCWEVRSVMGIMPYQGDWVPMAEYLYDEPWDFDLEPGIPRGKTWGSAMAYCWQLAGVEEPWKLPESLSELYDALAGRNPNLAAAIEAGLPGMIAANFNGLFAPAGVAKDIVDMLADETRKAMADPQVQDLMIKSGFEPVTDSGPEPAQREVASEYAR